MELAPMKFRFALLLLLLSPLIFADCVGYSDSFDLRVLDAKYRPIDNASVWIKYDRGTSFGDKYFTTPVKYTDSSGKVHFDIYNMGTTTRKIDCNIVVSGSAGGFSKTMTIKANTHGPIVDIVLSDVYPVRFFVKDKLGAPIQNASVTLGTRNEKTDSNGIARFLYKKGTYSYLASYLDAKQAGSLTISDDTDYEVRFSFNKITMNVTDDNGNPINASLLIFNRTYQLKNGYFEYDKAFGDYIGYTVSYKGASENGTIDTAYNPSPIVRFDLHAPLLSNINSSTVNKRSSITVDVSDPGIYSSGVDVSSIKVEFKVEPSQATTPWNKAVTFSTGKSSFRADFPQMAANSIVKFRIEIKDKSGNRAEVEGKFSTYEEAKTGQNQTQTPNGTKPQNGPVEDQEIPLFYIIGGIILLLLGFYLVFRLKLQPSGGT
jgi:hypothetical protein